MQSTKALLYNMYQRSNYGGADPSSRPVYSNSDLWLLVSICFQCVPVRACGLYMQLRVCG